MVTSAVKDSYRGVFDHRLGFGARPAVLVVDFVRAYTTPGSPLYAADVCDAVARTAPVLELARARGVPVIFTRVAYAAGGADGGLFVRKVPVLRQLTEGAELAAIDPALAPSAGELVITKKYASAFFATPLAPMLTASGIDTVIVTGCSTSGCVRATAVDGMQHGFRVVVPRQCVGDRAREPHDANLFDIDSKYGDVVDVTEVEAYLADLKAITA